jgi:hypothetical protein
MRSSKATSRSSSSRPISACAQDSYSTSTSGGPRHRSSARCSVRARLVDEPLELDCVGLADAEQVARRPCDEDAVGKRLAQLRDVALHDLRCGCRRVLIPELVDQPIGGDGLVGVQQQERQERALSPGPELEFVSVLPDLERAEDTKAHCNATPAPQECLDKQRLYQPLTTPHRRSTGETHSLRKGCTGGGRSGGRLIRALLAFAAAGVTAAAVAGSPALASPGYLRPDNRAVGPHPDPATSPVSARAPTARTVVVVRVTHPGFDWRDAAIGAAAGAGLVLLLLGASLLIRRAGREPRPV